jgi:SSS family transporter
LAAIVGLGSYFVRHGKTTQDFFIAGGRLPWWAVGLSVFGTQLSAITFMAIPAKAYREDWINIVSNAAILFMSPVIIFVFLPVFRRAPIISAYEYLEHRFGKMARAYGGVSFILMQAGRMGIVMFLPAAALAEVTGFDVHMMILVMGILVIVYTVLGGIEAVIWTDVIQVIVLLGGALLAVIVMAANVDGGLGWIISTGREAGKFHWAEMTWNPTQPALWLVFIGNLFYILIPYGSDQAVIQRYLTVKTEKDAARSIWVNAILSMPASLLFFFIGSALFAFYQAHPGRLDPALNPERIFPFFIVSELHGGLAGLLIAALFAAAMSTLDSSLNSVSTVCVNDFYRPYMARQKSDRHYLAVARGITVFWGMIATTTALTMTRFQGSFFDMFLELFGMLGSGLAGVFCLGILTKRAHSSGVFAGIVASGIAVLVAKTYSDLHFFAYAPIGILTCFVVGWIASILIPPSSPGGSLSQSL